MRTKLSIIAASVVLCVMFVTPASSHHSFAMYDQTKTVTLTGVVRQFVAQANHADVREYWTSLGPYYSSRTERLWRTDLAHIDRSHQPPEPVVTTTFIDRHEFTLGGRRFELLATPGGETTDSLVVWLPEVRTVFTGNLM